MTTDSSGKEKNVKRLADDASPGPGLYLVATPIGNIRDITLRAIDTLKSVDLIACEDTRVTGKLLNAYDIDTRMMPYHDHNAAKMRPKLIADMLAGKAVALVSDAGTPLVSDPGYKLVADCHDNGIAVTALPGASAAVSGLIVSGLPSDRFLFAGFLPHKTKGRRDALAELAQVPATLVLYETGPRLAASLSDMAQVLGEDRPAAVTRELTKLYEEIRRATLGELAAHYAQAGAPRGEIAVVIGPPESGAGDVSPEKLDMMLKDAMSEQSLRDAVRDVAAATGLRKRQVYNRALELEKNRT